MAKVTVSKNKVTVSKDDEKQAGKTTLRQCVCVSAFQDARYGKQTRAHNIGKGKVHCTVCGTEKLK